MKSIGLFSILLGGMLLSFSAAAHASDETAAAKDAAVSWIALIDSAQYARSWEVAAKPFQSAITQDQWRASVGSIRLPLGEVTSRTLRSANRVTSLPNAPSGEYVVIQYSTTFANKPEAIETVTPMKDEAGKWRVSGYYIK